MKIIDADKLHYKKVWIRYEYDEKADVVVFAREIDKAEKIEAIPVEWIEDYVQDHWRTTKLYATNYVWQILADWEKENEIDRP